MYLCYFYYFLHLSRNVIRKGRLWQRRGWKEDGGRPGRRANMGSSFKRVVPSDDDLWILPANETADVIRRPFNWASELQDKWWHWSPELLSWFLPPACKWCSNKCSANARWVWDQIVRLQNNWHPKAKVIFFNTLLLECPVDGGILVEGMRCRKH